MAERSAEDFLAILELMVANCSELVASLARASAVLTHTKSELYSLNPTSD